ncbi:MAG: hypothetical protein R3E52_01250 [Burkholderiaceae bacterium]
MTLFQFNIVAMVISCVLLVGGYSGNRTRLGGVAMGLGLIGLLLVIINSIVVLTTGQPFWAS